MNRPLARLTLVAAALAIGAPAGAQLPSGFSPFAGKGLTLKPPRLLAEPDALRDVYVLPSRPGQNRVPYWDYEWHTFEFATERGGGGVRLFFYEREREAASYAVSSIREQYVRLTDVLHYLPRSTIPFILYASYAEFQATNVFFVTEGTLGATDPRDLRMSQPFFGSVRQFTRVSTHELAHQLTIQKVRDVAAGAGVENPLFSFPLWFIEGLAEYATWGGMDPEGDYILRDLLTNPDPMKGYALPGFFDANAGGYIGVYKLGQARLSFIGEVYGHEKVLELLERSPLMAGADDGPASRPSDPGGPGESRPEPPRPPSALAGPLPAQADEPPAQEPPPAGEPDVEVPEKPEPTAAPERPASPGTSFAAGPRRKPRSFEEFVTIVLGEPRTRIEARYQEWLKRRYFSDYLASKQTVADFRLYQGIDGEPDSLSISEDGKLVVYRTVERETGLSTLHLQDLRDPRSRMTVARDQRPGMESLHPVDRRVTALRAGVLAFVARSGQSDVFYVRRVKGEERKGPRGLPRVKLELEDEERFDLGEILEVYDPALSPDGTEVAFAGIDLEGFRDLYVLSLAGPAKGSIRRLTDDVWSEADLAWDGRRLLYVSDRTESHETNVFAFDLDRLTSERLTFSEAEERNPVPALGGVVFRSLRSGKPDLWKLEGGRVSRLTDTPSAVLNAVPEHKGGLLALVFHGGGHRFYRIPRTSLLDEPEPASGVGGSASAGALAYPRALIPEQTPAYSPASFKNLRVDASAAGLVGPVSAGAAGVAITDLLGDHALIVNLAVYGSLKLTDALAFYVDQSRRPELGIGAFHTFEPRRDKTFPDELNYYLQRSFGVAGMVRYPFDRFRRVELGAEVRGIERFSFTDYSGALGGEWQRLNGGLEPELVLSALAGWDTTRLHYLAGPVEGSSAQVEASVGYLPVRQFPYLRLMADAQHRIRLIGRTNLQLRGAVGGTSRGRFAPQFYLFSVGNLEGYRFGDDRLLGDNYYVANLRLNLPVDQLVQIPIFTGLYGVAGADFGGVFDRFEDAWGQRSLAGVLGVDAALGALVLQLHWGKLVGFAGGYGPEPWVFNLNFRYLYQ